MSYLGVLPLVALVASACATPDPRLDFSGLDPFWRIADACAREGASERVQCVP